MIHQKEHKEFPTRYDKKAAPVQMLFIWSLMMMTAAVFNMLFASSTIGPFNGLTALKLFALFPVGGFFFLAQIVAARMLPLGDCQAIFATVPAFTMIFGKIFLRCNHQSSSLHYQLHC